MVASQFEGCIAEVAIQNSKSKLFLARFIHVAQHMGVIISYIIPCGCILGDHRLVQPDWADLCVLVIAPMVLPSKNTCSYTSLQIPYTKVRCRTWFSLVPRLYGRREKRRAWYTLFAHAWTVVLYCTVTRYGYLPWPHGCYMYEQVITVKWLQSELLVVCACRVSKGNTASVCSPCWG